jgi:hypothetical protein
VDADERLDPVRRGDREQEEAQEAAAAEDPPLRGRPRMSVVPQNCPPVVENA